VAGLERLSSKAPRGPVLGPAQAERWAWIVAFAYAQLELARPLVAEQPRRLEK
jgi:hypothetical protein